MFRLRRHKSAASDNAGEKFGFVFSNIQALQVPKGWDKLSVSLVSVETGKTICKLEKASVNNGTCQWTEPLWSPEEYASKELDHFKFLVSMGSSRAGILGEAAVNLGDYKDSEASIPVSLPLKKCNKGTVLNFEIKCLTPRTSFRGDELNSTAANTEEKNSENNGKDNKAEEINHSPPSMEDPLGNESLSSGSNSSEVVSSATERQESTESGGSAPWNSYSNGSPKTNKLSISSQGKHPQHTSEEIGHCSQHITRTSLQEVASSTNFPQAGDANFEELKAEARMWELNARRLMTNMETLKKEFADQSQHITDMEMELSASREESDRLMQDIKHLEVLLEESNAKEIDAESLNLQAKNSDNIRKELEDELRFQRESNNNLSSQLRKSQESNLELVSVLQELEETVQKQKMEIENLSALNSTNGCGDEVNEQAKSTEQDTVEKQCHQESHMALENSIIQLEKALELERDLRAQEIFNCEEKWRSRTISLETDIANLQLKLSKSSSAEESEENETGSIANMDLIKEIESLKKTIQELERECNELAEENLELVFKLKEARKDPSNNHDMVSSKSHEDPRIESPTASEFEAIKFGSQSLLLEDEMIEEKAVDSLEVQNSDRKENHSCMELHFQAFKCKACDLNVEVKLKDKQATEVTLHPPESQRDEVDSSNFTLKDVCEGIRYSEPKTTMDIDSLLPALREQLELFFHSVNGVERVLFSPVNIEFRNATFYKGISKCTDPTAQEELAKVVFNKLVQLLRARLISGTNQDKYNEDGVRTEVNNTSSEKGDIITSDSIREDMTGSICENISDKIHEMKFLELENEKHELESFVYELEKENVQLSERVSGLEAQLRHLTDTMELSRIELHHKENCLSNLQDKIGELQKEKESQKLEMKQGMLEMQKRWLDAQEESEYLKKANPKLQATAESLIEECDSLQILNGELRRQRLEFKVQCNLLEAELRKYQHSYSNCLDRIGSLEAKLSSILEEASSKEIIMNSKLEAILLQNKEYKERLVIEESLRSKLCQQAICDTEDKKASEGFPKMHSLLAENRRLKLTLQDLEISKSKLENTQMEYERKVQDLMSEVDAHKTNQEVLAAKSDKLQRLLENAISSEANMKCRINNLESKLLLLDSEKLQLADANSSLKIELLKIALLQDEVLTLKGSLNDMKFKNERLEASLQLICGENEELKADKTSLIQELSGMQNSVAELEECRYRKVVLEEKVLRLEGDLTAREVMCTKDAELKNELGQSRRENSQLHWKIKQLELERYHLQEELKRKGNSVCSPSHSATACKLSKVGYSHCNGYETTQIPAIDCASRSQLGVEKTQSNRLEPEAEENANEYKAKISNLEAELEDISERYLDMSLKYAEVENQNGKLVMTLKSLQDQRAIAS